MQLPPQTFAEVLEALRGRKSPGGGAEKRQATRFELQTRVLVAPVTHGAVGHAYDALTRDLSYRGIGLLQCMAMKRGDEFIICLPRPGTRPPLFLQCSVMFAGPLCEGLTGIGAQFNAPATDAQTRALDPARQEQLRIQNSVLG